MSKRNKTNSVVCHHPGVENFPECHIKEAVLGDVQPGSIQWELEGSFLRREIEESLESES